MTYDEQLISNSSYTNKDFQSIYPALLDLVKKITYRWDPSISNESDPGVILLKLNAIIADKCNYNIDKNILECFPLSVTQERNARQLYAQLGYYMHWYLAATGAVALRWSADTVEGKTYTIPRFTMVSDEGKEIVYTITEPLPLPLDGTFVSYNVIQGTVADFTVNGDTLITAQNLDADNRLYFTDTNVAQNGIFIRNANQLNYDDWQIKDNLSVESVSSQSRFYSFGVSLDTNVCYIEFPVNAQELFGDGIYITYIKTNGYSGNVAPFSISKFYNDVTIQDGSETQSLDSSNVQISNFNAITNGEDPESITDAYNGYKKVVGTFDTLITIRDYINAILNMPTVSNGFVCDRTNDIDSTLQVMESVNKLDTLVHEPLKTNGFSIYPFDLKFYMLYAQDEYSDLTTDAQFKNTFRLLEDMDIHSNDTTAYAEDVLASLQETKAIQQNLNSLLTIGTYEETVNNTSVRRNTYIYGNSICMVKNKFPIRGTIIPQYRLTSAQIDEVLVNIKYNLLNNLNSRELNFGEEMNYDTVYSLIVNSDERIKSVMLDDITYQTYVTYLYVDTNKEPHFLDIRIDAKESQLHTMEDLKLGYTCTVNGTPATDSSLNNKFNLSTFQTKTNYAHGEFNFIKESNKWNLTISQTVYDVDDVNGSLNLTTYKDVILENYGILDDSIASANAIKVVVKGLYNMPYVVDGVSYTSIYDYLRVLILTRSILAGRTPYFIQDTVTPAQTINQESDTLVNIKDVTALKLKGTLSTIPNPPTNSKVFSVDNNTVVEFTSPNLIATDEYSSYVKYEYRISTTINPNTHYILSGDEYIAFYWTADEDSGNNYAVYGAGTIIQPTFTLIAGSGNLPNVLWTMLQQVEEPKKIGGVTYFLPDDTVDAHIKELERQGSILSSTKRVSIKKQNDVTITDTMYCSWVLNEAEDDYYVLFGVDEGDRILKNGEYFMYTNQAKSTLIVLGQGTKIHRDTTAWNSLWQCKKFDYSEIVSNGLEALINNEGSLVNIPSGQSVNVVEMQYIAIPSGGRIKVEKINEGTLPDRIEINGTIMATDPSAPVQEVYEFDPTECKVNYSLSTSSDWIELPLNILSSGSSFDLGWTLYCSGVIDITADERFILESTQELEVSTDDATQDIIGSTTPYVVTNTSVFGEGRVEVDKIALISYDILDIVPVSGKDESCISFSHDGSEATCLFDLGEYTGELQTVENQFTIDALPGNYVMRADLGAFSSISVYYWKVKIIVGEDDPIVFNCNYGECSSIYYHIDSDDGGPVTLTIKIEFTTDEEHLPNSGSYTLPITGYRLYTINTYVDEITGVASTSEQNDVIEATISMLRNRCVDVPFNFDYSYVVDSNEIVRYPLFASSFFNINHIYNSYTIAQYDIDTFYNDENGLFITNKVR